MKGTKNVKVFYGHSAFTSLCVCGARFEGTGKHVKAAMQAALDHVCPPCDEYEVRTYWLSFCDGHRPPGQQLLGVCIVDVTRAEADDALLNVMLRFPFAQAGAEWIAAASRNAHRAGCNPGGEMASVDITGAPPPVPLVKNRLMSFQELEDLGLEPCRVAELAARAGQTETP